MKTRKDTKLIHATLGSYLPGIGVASVPGAAKRASRAPVLLVPDSPSAAELVGFCDELFAALAAGPDILTLRFVGPHHLTPDTALILYSMLTRRGGTTRIRTEAWSPVLGPSLLVFLAGDIRCARSTTYFYFRSLKAVTGEDGSPSDFDKHPDSVEDVDELWKMLTAVDYETVLGLLSQYLPVEELAGKLVRPAMLGELGLLGEGAIDEMLHRCLGVDMSAVDVPAKVPAGTNPRGRTSPSQQA